MAYTVPDYAAFIARFPIFDNTVTWPQSVVELVIAEAARTIDTTWREVDYEPAILYLSAHLLALDNSEEGGEIEIGGPQVLASESFAGMSMGYKAVGSPDGSAGASSYGATSYGRRYYTLLRNNKPGVVIA